MSSREEEEDQDFSNGSEDEDNYHYDDFVVPDEGDELSNEEDQKKRKKQKKIKEILPDDEDYELLQENNQPNKRRRIRKLSRQSDDESFEQQSYDQPIQPKQKNNRIQLQDEDFENDEDQELDDEIPQRKYQNIKEVFDNFELEEKFQTEEDNIIVQKDVPERLQLRFKNRQYPDKQELFEETKWIHEHLPQNIINNPDKELKNQQINKIYKVLEFIRVDNFEIMYLHFYKKPELLPELQLKDLQDIYQLDQEWAYFYQKKENTKKLFDELGNYMKIHYSVKSLLNENLDKACLDFQTDYVNYHLKKFIDPNQVNQNQQYKAPIQKVFQWEACQCKLDKFGQLVGLTADQLADNLASTTKHKPKCLEETPDKVANNFLQSDQPLVSETLAILKNLCKYLALELFYQPVVRMKCLYFFYKYACIYTEPTAKGKTNLDVQSPYFFVKRIYKREIKQFSDETWLVILQQEKEGNITVDFRFPWHDEPLVKDEIYKILKSHYLQNDYQEQSQEMQDIIKQWNILREEVLRQFLQNMLYPSLKKHVREDLTQTSQKYLAEKCSIKFKKLLNSPPLQAQISYGSETRKMRALGCVYETEKQCLHMAFVDENGKYKDHLTLKYFAIPNADQHVDQLIKTHYKDDEIALNNFIKDYQPDFFVVSTNCIDARRIMQKLRKIYEKQPFHVYGDNIVPYFRSLKPDSQLMDLKPIIRECVSLVRLRQNPIAEILNLWSDKDHENACFSIPVHPYQSLVPTNKLRSEYEKVIVECVNSIGVDINDVIQCEHLQATLQFVCGFGLRKAKHFFEFYKKKQTTIVYRMQLYMEQIIKNCVYKNCIGFLKIQVDYDDQSSNYDYLDSTRIHPNNYNLAKKIAKDALDDEEQDDIKCVQKIMRQPEKLEDLDLDDYADHLAQVKQTPNMIILLKFIASELNNPFKDPRVQNQEMKDSTLFYKLLKESPLTFRKQSLVNCRIIRVYKKNLTVKILDNGLVGNIAADDIYDKNTDFDLTNKFKEFECFKARVKKIEESKFKVDLTKRPSDLKTTENTLHDLIPNWDKIKKTFKIIESEDFQNQEEKVVQHTKYIPRKINHPNFKNMSYNGALDFLQDKPVGDFVFRTNSKGNNILNLTWKFYETSILHLQIKEEQKTPWKKLYIGKDCYDSLNEIIDKYINPCNQLMNQTIYERKFMRGVDLDYIQTQLLEDRLENPQHIPYYFGCTDSHPQYIVLQYIAKGNEVTKEYIKVKPQGLFFHGLNFVSLPMLIQFFKQNWRTPEYQKYLKRIKAPDTPYHQMQQNENYMESPNFFNMKNENKSPYAKSPYSNNPHSPSYNFKGDYQIKPEYKNEFKYDKYSNFEMKQELVKNEFKNDNYMVKTERSPGRNYHDKKRSKDYRDYKDYRDDNYKDHKNQQRMGIKQERDYRIKPERKYH